ncbi:tRNA (adenosine(37)-N6)-threonylcarbamoyltransferase complex dimerization subunit type 1 TsaB [Acidipila rosea]|uniref:tRNA threonylcarbamoyladenosine biosynthesis protein TsaB n=1 Tax=Acidipila rosea TaxID=768535 RepID=A0A4R1L272_9BACT|nr:tRNA (adenosine(37)-N6)-threonylcarbamoyltransferase complex dimerization subunit type 1 TsaB [Acidipila rosea]TCK72092.1 tRNA threonylcarbamoyladenosine biosynthesis protein TsaB [Acidipila rosea]
MSKLLLAIDTCGTTGSIAVARISGDQVQVVADAVLAGRTYAAVLVPRIKEALGGSRPDAIAAVNGPGSFTGVRVGVSAAKALAEAWSTPLIAISRLDVLARKAGTRHAALDAGRGEFYFSSNGKEFLATADTIREHISGASGQIAICEDIPFGLGVDAEVQPCLIRVETPLAVDALILAVERYRAGSFDNPATLDGNYLRRSDAELFARPKAPAQPAEQHP